MDNSELSEIISDSDGVIEETDDESYKDLSTSAPNHSTVNKLSAYRDVTVISSETEAESDSDDLEVVRKRPSRKVRGNVIESSDSDQEEDSLTNHSKQSAGSHIDPEETLLTEEDEPETPTKNSFLARSASEDADSMCYSPSTRMSITGIRPEDLSDGELLSESDGETNDTKEISVDVKSDISIKSESSGKPIDVVDLTCLSPSKSFKDNSNAEQCISPDKYQAMKNEVESMKADLRQRRSLYEKMKNSLPDKGEKLREIADKIEVELKNKTIELASVVVKESDSPKITSRISNTNEGATSTQLIIQSWDEIKQQTDTIAPVYTGKQGLKTFTNQKTMTIDCLQTMYSSLTTCPSEDILCEQPKGLKIDLMAHQKHALAWLNWRENGKPHGGILADDMGLGKTLTMISLMLMKKDIDEDHEEETDVDDDSDVESTSKGAKGWISKGRRDFKQGNNLVICPASLAGQWKTEIEKRLAYGKLSAHLHHGPKRTTSARELSRYDVVITTYAIVHQEFTKNNAIFGVKWNRIILDEGHVIRNHKTKSSEAVCHLQSRFRWILTGTPIHNKEGDLFALIKFLRCKPFNDLGHWKRWIDKSAGGIQRLNTLMKTLMLRRTKAQLQDVGQLKKLPTKTYENISVKLSPNEMNIYQKILVFSRTLFSMFLHQHADREANKVEHNFMRVEDPNGVYTKMHTVVKNLFHRDAPVKAHQILVLLLRLRQICCHPGLIDSFIQQECPDELNGTQTEDSESEETINLLDALKKLKLNEADGNLENTIDMPMATNKILSRSNPAFDMTKPSSKLKSVMKLLRDYVLDTDDRAIIVSQFTSVLDLLGDYLRDDDIPYCMLTGKVAVKDRNDIVEKFNNQRKDKVMLLSLTAGGVGLNLTGANILLLIDIHWNPQLEAQAQDRIYRMGQTKPVKVFRFICDETIEERIRQLQEKKLEIARNVLSGSKVVSSKLTIADLKSLFDM